MSEFDRLSKEFGWRIEDHARLHDGVWLGAAKAEVSFPAGGHDWCAELEDKSFWFWYRNRLIMELIEKRGLPSALWDIGSGNGCVSVLLQENGMDVVAVEPEQSGVLNAFRRGVRSNICGTIEDLRLPDCSLSAACCFDVIEHLPRPDLFLSEVNRVLVPGGWLAVSVPAMPSLWSQMDDISGHFTRFAKKDLDVLMMNAGLHGASSYVMSSLVMPAFLLRALPYRMGFRANTSDECLSSEASMVGAGSGLLGYVFRAVAAVELVLGRFVNLPCGTACMGIYEKRD